LGGSDKGGGGPLSISFSKGNIAWFTSEEKGARKENLAKKRGGLPQTPWPSHEVNPEDETLNGLESEGAFGGEKSPRNSSWLEGGAHVHKENRTGEMFHRGQISREKGVIAVGKR